VRARGSHRDARKRAAAVRSSRRTDKRRIKAARPPAPPRFAPGVPRRRLLASLVVLLVVLTALLVRVGQLQTTEAADLRNSGARQWTRSQSIAAKRGAIFDRNGNEIAMSVPARTVTVNPQQVEDEVGTARVLGGILGLPRKEQNELIDVLRDKEKGFAYVARQVDPMDADQIDDLGLVGVDTNREDRRIMPGGETASSVIGLTDIDGKGIAGLELQYDDLLRGTGGEITRQVAPEGRSIPGSEQVVRQASPGDDLVLTIDRSVQFAAERGLLQRVDEIHAKGGSLIVMDTDTGELLAMASVRRAEKGGYEITSGNFAAVDAYEPGSVAKVISVAAALNERKVSPETTFEVPMSKWYHPNDPKPIEDATGHGPVMTVHDILVLSSNIGTITASEQIGVDKQVEYMRAFGLGTETALDFPGENPGILKDADELQGLERQTIAYGQGFSSTSAQLVSVVNTLANGGTYVAPKLLRATVGPDGEITETAPSESRRVVSEKVADQMTVMMKDVVCRGTAQAGQVPGMSIAGKTGTGLKAQPNGGYLNEKGERVYYASFVGFFPAERPEVTMLVSIDEPPARSNDRFGGSAAAPLFAQLAPSIMHELEVRPPVGSTGCEDSGS
jgi:cell division protein FtsI (penicillin-binding protein 3)